MSIDMYGPKVADACALIREFAKTDYYHYFASDYEGSLEAFIAMLDQAEEKGWQEQAARIADLERENARLNAALDEEISTRDQYHEWADRLAAEIARYFGVDIGEHSNANNPWEQAYEAVPAEASAPAVEQQPEFWKSQRKMIERAIIGLRDGWATRKDADDALALLAAAPQAADTDKVREETLIRIENMLIEIECGEYASNFVPYLNSWKKSLTSMGAPAERNIHGPLMIARIKRYRDVFGCTLKEAKEAVEFCSDLNSDKTAFLKPSAAQAPVREVPLPAAPAPSEVL